MFERLSNSWELVKASAAVLKADRELLLFPVVSAVLSVLVALTFAVPAFLSGFFAGQDGELSVSAQGYLLAFLFYVVQYFVIFFCNTALVGAAMIRLRGGDPTVGDGFRIAASRTRDILGYAIISATVGMVLRAISERSGLLGRLVVGAVGLAWNLATYLVVPVLVVEDVGPIEAVRQSAGYLKKTWGEQIAGNVGMGLVFGLISLVPIALGALVFGAAVELQSTALAILAVAGVAVALVAIGLVSSALGGVYAAAVYRYAAEGETGTFFTPALVKNAFRRK
ncbi:MAG: hypothetical protein H6Q10_1419 [Acidobacteria bacterium]|nr:hypothetical protein [Acidobacteriota bacterium]